MKRFGQPSPADVSNITYASECSIPLPSYLIDASLIDASLITIFRDTTCLTLHKMLSSAILAALTCLCHKGNRCSSTASAVAVTSSTQLRHPGLHISIVSSALHMHTLSAPLSQSLQITHLSQRPCVYYSRPPQTPTGPSYPPLTAVRVAPPSMQYAC